MSQQGVPLFLCKEHLWPFLPMANLGARVNCQRCLSFRRTSDCGPDFLASVERRITAWLPITQLCYLQPMIRLCRNRCTSIIRLQLWGCFEARELLLSMEVIAKNSNVWGYAIRHLERQDSSGDSDPVVAHIPRLPLDGTCITKTSNVLATLNE